MAEVLITVVYSPASRQIFERAISVPGGSSVLAALQASGLLAQTPGLQEQLARGTYSIGIWAMPVDLQAIVKTGDRIEICRPLLVDPKTARRERFKRQGIQRAGLFAKGKRSSGT